MKTLAFFGVCILLLSASPLVAQTDGTTPTRTIITPREYPTKVESLGAGVNSSADDFAPALIGQGRVLYFTTTRNGQQDVFSASKSGTRWSGAASVGTSLNTSGQEGGTTITPDGKWMIFTACDRSDGEGDCDLYIAENIGGTWSNIRNMGDDINSEAWESQPALSPDASVLFFASNRRGGRGGLDIWMAQRRSDGTWDDPVNLGSRVNTAGDETAPGIAADNRTLYFSSNAHPGIGGFDIYRTVWHDGSWSIPEHAGTPMNSPDDDYFCGMFPGSDDVYFASNRAGGAGGLDLYMAHPNPLPPSAVTTVIGNVRDIETKAPIGASLTVRDIKTNTQVATFHSSDVNGEYVVVLQTGRTYVITAESPGYLFYSDRFEVPANSSNTTLRKDIDMSRDAVRLLVYFDFDKSILRTDSYVDLDRAVAWLEANPTLRVEVSGHTDNVGKHDYNMRLSQERAKAVYDYLIAKDVSSRQITHKGYGPDQPVATNDTEDGRQLNRRVEFRVKK